MIRCRVIEQFTLKDFDKLSNIKRKSIEEKGKLFIGDEFECDEKMASYLTGDNEKKKVVVKVIEVLPKEKPIIVPLVDNDKEAVIPLESNKELSNLVDEIGKHINNKKPIIEVKIEKSKKSKK